jgi:hypothetical protein
LSTRYQAEEKALFAKIMQDDYPGWLEKTLVVSGIMMNLWRMFDESKLSLLFDACQSGEQHTKQRALVAICFTMARHNRFLTYFPAIRNRFRLRLHAFLLRSLPGGELPAVHHSAFAQFLQIVLINRYKSGSRGIIQHQCVHHLIGLAFHELLRCVTLPFIFIHLVLSRETELTAYHKARQKYVNEFCFHNSSFFLKTILLI